jgi:hypothetical protein
MRPPPQGLGGTSDTCQGVLVPFFFDHCGTIWHCPKGSARDELAYPGTDRVSSSVYCAFGQRSVLQAADHADQREPRFGADVVQLRLARKVMLRGLRGKLGGVAHLGDDRFAARRRWAQRDKDRLRFLSGFQFGVVSDHA